MRSIYLQYSGERSTGVIEKSLDFTGSIVSQLERLEKLAGELHTSRITGLLRKSYDKFPAIAVREFLVNAFIHRDYRMEGDTKVTAYSNRLEISSTGGLYGDVTIESIRHAARPVRRNPNLSALFYDLKLCERYASGVQRAFDIYGELNAEEIPEMFGFGDSFLVKLPRLDEHMVKVREKFREYPETPRSTPSTHEENIIHYLLEHGVIKNGNVQDILELSAPRATQILREMVEKEKLISWGEKRGRLLYDGRQIGRLFLKIRLKTKSRLLKI